MPNYKKIKAKDSSRQHVGDVYGGQINNYHVAHDSDRAQEALVVPQLASVRSIDARFDGDEKAIAIWLKENNLPVVNQKDSGRPSIIDRISAYSVRGTHRRLSARKLDGTVEWIADAPKLVEWLSSKKSAELFLVGKGCGKTTAMTSIVQVALRELPTDNPVLSFFFEHPMRSEIDLFSSLTQQLLRWIVTRGEELLSDVRRAIRRMYGDTAPHPTLEEIRSEIFEPVIKMFASCAIIIDGIDNSDIAIVWAPSLISYLHRLGEHIQLKVLISTRLQWPLPRDAAFITLDTEIVGAKSHYTDIVHFVDTRLKPLCSPGQLLEDAKLHDQVRKELLDKAEGMFLWVTLQIECLFGPMGGCTTVREVRQRLGTFPEGLDGIYAQCLTRRAGPEARYITRIISWVCSAPEPTHLDHIRELLAFKLDDRSLEPDDIPSADSVRRAATELIVTGPATSHDARHDGQHMFPAHPTVRDFIFSAKGFAALESMCNLASIRMPDQRDWSYDHATLELGGHCAAYLMTFSGREVELRKNNIVRSDVPTANLLDTVVATSMAPSMAGLVKHASAWLLPRTTMHELPTRNRRAAGNLQNRLLDYARRNWRQCLRNVDHRCQHFRIFQELVLNHAEATMQPWSSHRRVSPRTRVESLLFWALANDHCPLLELAIEQALMQQLLPSTYWTQSLPDCGNKSIFSFAIGRCSTEIVSQLLALCVDMVPVESESTPLHIATERGNESLVRLLLDYSAARVKPYAKINDQDRNGRIPLHLAAMHNHERLCDMLIPEMHKQTRASKTNGKSIPVNYLDRAGRTPLYYALVTSALGVVTVLLQSQTITAMPDLLLRPGGTIGDCMPILSAVAKQHLLTQLARTSVATIKQLFAVQELDEIYAWASGLIPGQSEVYCHPNDQFLQKLIHPRFRSREEIFDRYSTIHQIARRLNPAEPKAAFRSERGLNFLGMALYTRDPATIDILGRLDSRYILEPVGVWRGQLSPTEYFKWTPLEFAVKLGYREGVQQCLAGSDEGGIWRARNLAAALNMSMEFDLLTDSYLKLVGLTNGMLQPSEPQITSDTQKGGSRSRKESVRNVPQNLVLRQVTLVVLTNLPCAALVLTGSSKLRAEVLSNNESNLDITTADNAFITIKAQPGIEVQRVTIQVTLEAGATESSREFRLELLFNRGEQNLSATSATYVEQHTLNITLHSDFPGFRYRKALSSSSFKPSPKKYKYGRKSVQLFSAVMPASTGTPLQLLSAVTPASTGPSTFSKDVKASVSPQAPVPSKLFTSLEAGDMLRVESCEDDPDYEEVFSSVREDCRMVSADCSDADDAEARTAIEESQPDIEESQPDNTANWQMQSWYVKLTGSRSDRPEDE